MLELNMEEIGLVNGGISIRGIGYALGWITARGARSQQYIDDMENPMLGAMQYGA